jgi:hypothetical protein
MLKLTRHLFCWQPRAEYADYYERALYNHILASQNPETGMMCYYVPLRSGSQKRYNNPFGSFWCCTGTGIENHAKYGDSIYFHNDTNLWVNLFIASELNWKAKGLRLRQETKYPDQDYSRLTFTCNRPVELKLNIRRPYWALSGFAISVNGKKVSDSSKPGSYVNVSRTWKSGDNVEIKMPFTLRTEGFRDNPSRIAFMNGPLVLCAEVEQRENYPAIVAKPDRILTAIKSIPREPSHFIGSPKIFRTADSTRGEDITLEAFYQMHGNRRYVVYWDVFTPIQWQAKEERYKAELATQKQLEARTVDEVHTGEAQNERDHNLQGERTSAGVFSGRRWRHATGGGWFSYDVKVLPDQPLDLLVTYWGSDGGNRVFDIIVEGTKIATQQLQNNRPGEFYNEVYHIRESLTGRKNKVTVKFQAHPDAWAGGIFGLRILKPKSKQTSEASTPVIFKDNFDGKLAKDWTWLRENQQAWRIKERALEIRVEPGLANTVKNALLRTAPNRKEGKFAVEVTVTNNTRPTRQYEQAGITWYNNGRPVFKLVKELIDGGLFIIPGRKPMASKSVQLRLVVTDNSFTAQFRPDATGPFQTAATGRLPKPGNDQVSIQCYNGPPDAEHWIRFDDFRILQLSD